MGLPQAGERPGGLRMSSSHSPLQEKLETFTELYKNRKEIIKQRTYATDFYCSPESTRAAVELSIQGEPPLQDHL